MRSISFKLTLAFLMISLAGTILAAVFVRWSTVRAFDTYVRSQERSIFVSDARAYYDATGSWNNFAALSRYHFPPPAGNAHSENQSPDYYPSYDGQYPQSLRPARLPFVLADRNGIVVLPSGKYQIGMKITDRDLAGGTPVEVNGQVVGTVITLAGTNLRDPQEQEYLLHTNQALLAAGAGATLLALLLGFWIARTLTRPLRELTEATKAVAQGNLEQQVEIYSNDELGELAASFNQMSSDLARSNQLRKQMTADIAHDLRTPLTVVSGYLESLRDGILKPTPERFEMMYTESQHLQRLVEDLRTLSLADAGELQLNLQSVLAGPILERVASAYSRQAEERGIHIRVNISEPENLIRIDTERMMQVLGNLVSNALRYTPAGGEIYLSSITEDKRVIIRIADTGPGIAQEDLPHVFERFYRGDLARHEEGASGLGLAITKSIVEMQRGTVRVENMPGGGASFFISLPSIEQ